MHRRSKWTDHTALGLFECCHIGATSLAEHREALAPWWLSAEGFIHAWCAEAHLFTMRLAIERCSEWGDGFCAINVDLGNAFGANEYDKSWQALRSHQSGGGDRQPWGRDWPRDAPGVVVDAQETHTHQWEGGDGGRVAGSLEVDSGRSDGEGLRPWQARGPGIRLPNRMASQEGARPQDKADIAECWKRLLCVSL